jgi:hypothetical protein
VAYEVVQGLRVRTTIELEPAPAGGSLLTLTMRLPTLPGPLDGLAARLLRRSTEARGRGDLDRLVRALTAAPAMSEEAPAAGS